MTSQSKPKKVRVDPPKPPRRASKSSSTPQGSHKRAQSFPEEESQKTPLIGKYVCAPLAYPTPESANRGTASCQGRAPDHDSSDLDDARIIELGSPKRKTPRSTIPIDSDDDNNRPDAGKEDKGKSRAPLDLTSDSNTGSLDEGGSEEKSDKEWDEGESSAEDAAEDLGEEEHARKEKTLGPSTSKTGQKVAAGQQSAVVLSAFQNTIVLKHAKDGVLGACKLDHAQDAWKLEPRFDDNKRPIYIVDGGLVPDLGQKFDNQWPKWGIHALKSISNRMDADPQHKAWLSKVSDTDIRKAVGSGVYATMKTAYSKHRNGKREDWVETRKNSSKNWSRRNLKGENRMTGLRLSGLDVKHWSFITELQYQSDEESNPDDSSCRTVKVPAHRSKTVIEVMGACDVAFNANKAHRGNQKVEKYTYVKVNIPVPKLKNGEVPKWAVSTEWERANPDLEQESRRHIDPDQTEMPEPEKVKKFIHRYEPAKRTYQGLPSDSTSPLPVPPASVVSESEPAVETVIDSVPMSSAESTAADSALPPPLAELTFTACNAQPVMPGRSSVGPLTPTYPPALTDSHTLVQPPAVLHPLNPSFGAQPLFMPGSPGLQAGQLFPQAPIPMGQPLRVQTITGEWVWTWPTYPQPPVQYDQSGGHIAPQMDWNIDPELENQPSPSNDMPLPNNMPPPPELIEPTNLTNKPIGQRELPVKSNPKRGGRKGGAKGTRRGRASSKLAEEAPAAGPSQMQPGRTVKKITFKPQRGL